MVQLLLGALLVLAAGQSINFFSRSQDAEIGWESAKEAERSVALVGNTTLPHRHVTGIARRIVQSRSLPQLKYQFRIVNSKDINSAGFPGGAIYINRGLLEIAANDDEIAAMVAHELSHVASRHGTVQLSRQLLVQEPIAIAAGVPASQVWKDQITKLGIALGMEAPFLRYSRDQEVEAGLMAVRLMADARYDPDAFRTFLEKINESQSSDAPRTLAFVFNHPQSKTLPPELAQRIAELATAATRARARAEFRAFRSALGRLPEPALPPNSAASEPDSTVGLLPSVFTHAMDYYALNYPEGWRVMRTGPNGAMISPADGVQSSRSGDDLTHGIMFDLFDLSITDRPLTLEQATNRLIVFLRQRNQTLRIVPGAQTQTLVSDEPGLRTVLFGRSDASGQAEVAWVVTRLYYQSLFYMVLVAPEDEFPLYQPVFEQMIRSVRFR
jgi:Zn-dependent protease with chaperone function